MTNRNNSVEIRNVASVIRGVTYEKSQSSNSARPGMVPLLRATNIENELVFEDLVFVPEAVVNSQQYLQRGDIVIAASSGSLNVVGKAAPVRNPWHGTFGAFCFALRPREAVVRPLFLAYYMQTSEYRSAVSRLAAGVNINNLRREHIEGMRLPAMPLQTQDRVVVALESYVARLENAVTTLERVQRNLKRYRASVLKAAVEGRLVPTEAELARAEKRDYEPASELLKRILAERRRRWNGKGKYQEPMALNTSNLPELPEGWCWATVDMVGDVLLGRQRAPQYLTGKHSRPYLRVANIKDDHIDFSDVEEMDFDEDHFAKYRLQGGDILVSEGQSRELVGQSAIYRGQVDGLCFQKTLHRFRPAVPGPTAEFAQVVFRAHVNTGYFMSLAAITTNIAHLTLEKFKASRFPLPPAAEQARIVESTEKLLSVALEEEKIVKAANVRSTALRRGILKWAFEGRLVDQDPNDEPASALLERIRAQKTAKKS